MRRGRSAVATGVRAVLKQGTRVVSPRPAAHGRCDGEVVRLHVFHSAAALPPACREGAVCREVQPSAGRVHGCHGVGGLEPALVVPAGEAASAGVSVRRLKQPPPATTHHAVSLGVLAQSQDELVGGMVQRAKDGSCVWL